MTIDSPVASTAGSSATTFVPTGTATDHVGSADGAAAAEEVASVRSMQVTLNDSVVDAEKSGVKDASDIIWVDWDGADDPACPYNWSKRRRWTMSMAGIGFCALVSLSVSGYSISIGTMEEQLHSSRTLVLLGITFFTLTFGASPLLLAPISEVYGRTYLYNVSALVFTLFFIPQALARNIETMLISRFIAGIAGSSAVSLVGGTLADLWINEERGLPMALFAWSAFGSTGLGPVIFGYVEQFYDFRMINWIMLAISGAFTTALIVLLRETRSSVLLSRKAARLRKETGDDRYQCKADLARSSFLVMVKTSLTRPVRMLCTEPVLISFTLWISWVWGVLYVFLVAIPLVFKGVYGFTIGESGLVYISQVVGSCLGLFADHFFNKLYLRKVATRGPEARLYNAMVAGLAIPIGALIFSFTARDSIHWIVPCIGATVLYTGMFLIYLSCFSYLADAYTLYASSALSGMSFSRNLVGSVFPLFTTQLYGALGVQGAGGLTAGLGALLAATPFVMYRYGAILRARSPFARELETLRKAGEIR